MPTDPCTSFAWTGIFERMRQSARQLVLPEPDAAQLADMVRAVIGRCRDAVPEAPGALYLRPLLFGTTANIGAAATPAAEATLIVLASPVWDYFSGGMKPLRILVDDENTRSAAQMGMVKTGGNYAAALGPTLTARAKYQVDQVLFCPGGQVQETGAANFVLIREGEALDPQPRYHLFARCHARFPAHARPRIGLRGFRARLRRGRDARLGEIRRSGALGHGGGACRGGDPDLPRNRASGLQRQRWVPHAQPASTSGGHTTGRGAGSARLAASAFEAGGNEGATRGRG